MQTDAARAQDRTARHDTPTAVRVWCVSHSCGCLLTALCGFALQVRELQARLREMTADNMRLTTAVEEARYARWYSVAALAAWWSCVLHSRPHCVPCGAHESRHLSTEAGVAGESVARLESRVEE